MKSVTAFRQPAPSRRISLLFITVTRIYDPRSLAHPSLEANPVPTDVVVPLLPAIRWAGKLTARNCLEIGGSFPSGDFWLPTAICKWAYGRTAIVWIRLPKSGWCEPAPSMVCEVSLDLPMHLEQDLTVRYVDRLSSLNIPSYYSLDAQLGWKPIAHLELSVGGQNLLNKRHVEFIPEFIKHNTHPGGAHLPGTITWRFE